MSRIEALSYYRKKESERREEEARQEQDGYGKGHGHGQQPPNNVDADTWQNLPAKMKRHDDLVVNQQELEKHKQRTQQQ